MSLYRVTFDIDENQYDKEKSWKPEQEDIEDWIIDMSLQHHRGEDIQKLFTEHDQEIAELSNTVADDEIEESEGDIHPSVQVKFKAKKVVESYDDINDQQCGIVYNDALLELASLQVPNSCTSCASKVTAHTTKTGTCITIKWICQNSHQVYCWNSQPSMRNMFVGNFMLASLIVATGNNFEKIKHLLTQLNLGCVNKSSFYKIQHFYVCPSVKDLWDDCSQLTTDIHKRKEHLVVIGDGRNDSPGYSAQYCSYTLMEHDSHDILTQVVVDKREVELKSPNMERLGLQKALKNLEDKGLTVAEVVTDAHVQIASMMKKEHPGKVHSLDTWHGGKLYLKAIAEEGKKKQNRELLPWCRSLVNRFWKISQLAKGNALYIERGLHGSLKHITNEHVWPGGNCGHVEIVVENGKEKHIGDEVPEKPERPYLKKHSPAAKALRKIITNSSFVRKFAKYSNFRHTGSLESFHNVILAYASKRQSFGYEAYKCRNQLAMIDWQFHKDRAYKTTKKGEQLWHKKYNKNTNAWYAVKTKVEKTYDFMPMLQESIMQARLDDPQPLRRKNVMGPDNPKRLAHTIAKVLPPAMSELIERHQSRFSQDK